MCLLPCAALALATIPEAPSAVVPPDANPPRAWHGCSLQRPHPPQTPAEAFYCLAEVAKQLGMQEFDIYGDWDKDASASFLRRFELDVLHALTEDISDPRLQDAVFMPSGVMAQSIALLLHQRERDQQAQEHPKATRPPVAVARPAGPCFACHHTSHLLLHEEHAYRELLGMEAVVLSTLPDSPTSSTCLHVPPLSFDMVQRRLGETPPPGLSTLLLEIPHRELGGKTTPWDDILQMRDYCDRHGLRFHCDGARIFEATAAYYPNLTLAQIVAPFDSMYVSCYKGLGGLSGALLLGSTDFCAQARVWLRRFGGNLYTLLPYALSGWVGFRRQWLGKDLDALGGCSTAADASTPPAAQLSFVDKKDKLVAIMQKLSTDPIVSSIVTFDPPIPLVNMVHGYLWATPEQCEEALDAVQERTGIQVLVRVRPVSPTREPAHSLGYRSFFEWTMGEFNGNIPNECFLEGWSALAEELSPTIPRKSDRD